MGYMNKLITFPSGLKLVLNLNDAVRSVAVGVFVGAGSIKETADISGISHLIEHMTFKGTEKRSSFDIVNDIDKIGANINAYTTKSYTSFYTISLDANAYKCAEVLADMYFNPKFDDEELKKEKQVVIEEINESLDTPDDVCMENLFSKFYEGNPLENSILGSKDSVKSITRDDIVNYHKKHYVASNTILSIAGNLTEKSALDIVNSLFESRFTGKDNYKNEALLKAEHSLGFISKKKKDLEQTHLSLAFPCYPFGHEMNATVQLLSAVFSLEMSSRLFQSVREKLGLCYTVDGGASKYENNGVYEIYTSTSPDKAALAFNAICDEIDLLKRDGITGEELEKGKEKIKTAFVLGQESTLANMRTFGTYAMQSGELFDISKRIKEIDEITEESVLKAANEIFDFDKMTVSVVSNISYPELKDIVKKHQNP